MFVDIAFLHRRPSNQPSQAGFQEVLAAGGFQWAGSKFLDLGRFQGRERGQHIGGGRDDANLRDLLRSAGGGGIDTHGDGNARAVIERTPGHYKALKNANSWSLGR